MGFPFRGNSSILFRSTHQFAVIFPTKSLKTSFFLNIIFYFLPLFTLQAAFLIHVALQCEVFSNLEVSVAPVSSLLCWIFYILPCERQHWAKKEFGSTWIQTQDLFNNLFFFLTVYGSFISIWCGNNSQEISTSYSVPGLQSVVGLCWQCVTLVCIYRLLEQQQMAVLWSCDYRWQKAHLQLKSCWSHYQKVFKGSV